MDTDELFKSIVREENIKQATPSEVKLHQAQQNDVTIAELVPTLSFVSFVITGAMLLLMLSKVGGAAWFVTVKRLPQKIPCRKCQFFSSNPHLQCAINPLLVLSEEAVNCSDYLPKNNKFS